MENLSRVKRKAPINSRLIKTRQEREIPVRAKRVKEFCCLMQALIGDMSKGQDGILEFCMVQCAGGMDTHVM